MENYNNQYNYSSADITIKDITSVSHDIRTNPWKHVHDTNEKYEIYFVIRGETHLKSENEYIYKQNTFSFLTPHSTYNSNSYKLPTEMIAVYFTAELPSGVDNNIFSQNFTLQDCNETMRKCFKNIKNLYYSKQNNYELKIKKEMYNIFSIAADSHSNITNTNSGYYILRVADEYIRENYHRNNISVEQIADICKVTPAYFCRIYKNAFGVSPKKRIIELKMQAACKYLSLTSTPMSEIAKRLGYNELSYFTTAFKNHFGVTPSEYRKK